MRNMAKFVSTKINLTKINFLIGNFMSNNKQFFNCTHGYTGGALWKHKGWSRADLRLVYRFWGHLIWSPKFKKGRKIKHKVLHKNKKLPFCNNTVPKLIQYSYENEWLEKDVFRASRSSYLGNFYPLCQPWWCLRLTLDLL